MWFLLFFYWVILSLVKKRDSVFRGCGGVIKRDAGGGRNKKNQQKMLYIKKKVYLCALKVFCRIEITN